MSGSRCGGGVGGLVVLVAIADRPLALLAPPFYCNQSLDEVNIYISAPPGIKGSQIQCKIETRHLKIGLKGNPPFIDEPTGGPVVVDESLWTMSEDGEININLQKVKTGATWDSALMGRGFQVVDPLTKQEMQKKIMLERFQQENPGFDFSGAEFNGAVPDAATFMGGMRTT
jgi:hypothetical protein